MKKNKPSKAAKKPTAKKKVSTAGYKAAKSGNDTQPIHGHPQKLLPLRKCVTEFLGASDEQRDLHFAKLLKGLFRVLIAEQPSTVLSRNNRGFKTREVFNYAVDFKLFGEFKTDNKGNTFHDNNKKEFHEALRGYFKKTGQTIDQCFQVHDCASFQIRQKKALFSIQGVRLSLEESVANTLKLGWELMKIVDLPAACNDRLEEVKRNKNRSAAESNYMSLPRWTSKARQAFEAADRLFGANNPRHLDNEILEIANRPDSRDDVKLYLPSKKTALLDFQIALAKLIPRKLTHSKLKMKFPTADTIKQRKAILLDFLKSTLDYELFWTARSANSQPELLGDNYLNDESYPSPENLLEVWEIDGMPFRVFSALQKKLPAWWREKKRAIRRKSALSKRTSQRATRSTKKAPKSI